MSLKKIWTMNRQKILQKANIIKLKLHSCSISVDLLYNKPYNKATMGQKPTANLQQVEQVFKKNLQ